EAMLQQATARAQLQMQSGALGTGVTTQVINTNSNLALNNQLTSLVATSSARLNQLNNNVQRRFGISVAPFVQSDARFGIPANAFENNLRAASASFSTGLTNSVNSIVSQVQSELNTLTNFINNPSSFLNNLTGAGSTGTTSTGTTSTG